MSKNLLKILILALLFFSTISLYSKRKYSYIGSQKCKKCHSIESIGNQYKIWANSPHAKAWRRLKTKKSKQIAVEFQILTPSKDKKCLKCHSSGRGKTKAIIKEGVGCESCHGPGEKYHEMENHVDFLNNERAYQKAISNGMYPILGINHLKKREKMCLRCHNKKRLCFNPKKNSFKNQELPIQVIDKMKKGNINLSHPLRK